MELMVIAAVDFAIGWLAWIVIGGIAGALAGMVMRGGGFGILGDIIVGIVGAVVVFAHRPSRHTRACSGEQLAWLHAGHDARR